MLLLFAVNLLIFWAIDFRQLRPGSTRGFHTVRLLILPSLYTLACILILISFLKHPTTSRGLQVLAGTLVVGGLWYLTHRIRRAGKTKT
jgi:hypothetical protein